ncbi:MAG: substrate-binding domain-containing protein [Planctomycetota bacterium]
MKLTFASLGILLFAFVSIVTCSKQPEALNAPTAGAAKSLKFALIVKTQQNPVFICMQRGAEEEAKKLSVEVQTFSPAVEKNFQEQVELVRSAARKKFDAILIAPSDSKLLVAPLKEAADAGVPIINIDNALDPAELKRQNLTLDAFIGVDNVAGGRLGAQYLAQKIGGAGEVMMLEGFVGVANAEDRKRGFHEEIAKHPNIKLVASQTANWYTEEALTVTTGLLPKYPNLKGIFCANDLMALGAIRAVEQAGKTNSVVIVAFDNIKEVRESLLNGKLAGSIEQWPDWMGAEAVRAAHELKTKGKLTNRDRRSPIEMISKESLTTKPVEAVGVR